jgi:hypothetical protein
MFFSRRQPTPIGIRPQLPDNWQARAQPKAPTRGYVSNLGAPLFHWSPKDPMTLGQLCEGVMVFGGTGSGKTSSTGARIAEAMMKSGFGGVVLCVKDDEADNWINYAKQHGREHDLIIMDDKAKWRFNFFEYEMHRGGSGAGSTENFIQFLEFITKNDVGESGGKVGDGKVWEKAARVLMSNTVDLLRLGDASLTIPMVIKAIREAPKDEAQANDKIWQSRSPFYRLVIDAERKSEEELAAIGMDKEDRRAILDYWYLEFIRLAPETRYSVVFNVTSTLSKFEKGLFRRLCSTHTNFAPEMSEHGAIIILNLPVVIHGAEGALVQNVFKYFWQRAMIRRDKRNKRPVFLFADEAQYFLNEEDAKFQQIARSNRACTIYMTQDLSGCYAQMGGSINHDRVNNLVGLFQTKVFHQNPNHLTNEWSSKMIGRSLQWRDSTNEGGGVTDAIGETENYGTSGTTGSAINANGHHTYNHGSGETVSDGISRTISNAFNWGQGRNQQMDLTLEPQEFAGLMKGGENDIENNHAEAIVFQGGRRFKANDKKMWLRTIIPQIPQ